MLVSLLVLRKNYARDQNADSVQCFESTFVSLPVSEPVH